MRRLLMVSLSLSLLVVAAGVAAGQEGSKAPAPDERRGRAGAGAKAEDAPPPARGPRAGQPLRRGGPMTPQQLDQAFDRFMVTQARGELQLTDQQLVEFRPRLERLQLLRRQAQRQRRLLVNEVNQLTRGGAPMDDATVAAKLKAIDDQSAQADSDIRQAHQAIDAVLTPAQRLRFRGFEVRMERRKLELISRAQQQGRLPGRAPAP